MASAVSAPADLGRWGYHKVTTRDLGDGYSATLWLSRQPTTSDDFTRMLKLRPIVELDRDGSAVQWWESPVEDGYGWEGSLTCLIADRASNCAVTGTAGAHAGYGVAMVLRHGQLVSGAHASMLSDSSGDVAADLDGDGYLDIAGVDNDYTPNYATGHRFWRTYRFTGDALASTGCAPFASARQPAPSELLHGACPHR